MANYNINSKHAAYGLNVVVDIGGKQVPVVSASIEFSINQIPVANVVVPSGVEIKDGSKTQLFSEKELEGRKPAKIIVTVGTGRPHPAGSQATPTGNVKDLVIFDGYLAAKNVQFSVNGVSTTLTLFHWLHDLDYTTALTSTFVKATPNDWFAIEENPGTTNYLPFKVGDGVSIDALVWRNKDWWNDIMVPGITYTASKTRLKTFNIGINTESNKYTTNALAKMRGQLIVNSTAKRGLESALLTSGIRALFTETLQSSKNGSSNFEKLVNLGREFQFMLAPKINVCEVVPYNPTAKVKITIPESEFDFGFSSSNPTVVPSGVVLYGLSNTVGVTNNKIERVDDLFLGSFKAPDSSKIGGPLFTVMTPAWMQQLQIYISNENRQVIITTDSESPKSIVEVGGVELNAVREFTNNYAKAVYFDNLFSAKVQEVICGFRTDVSPGDCIALTGKKAGLNVSGSNTNDPWTKRGMVESVSYLLHSGDLPKINTVYRLRHVFDTSDIEAFQINENAAHPIFEDYNSELKLADKTT